MNKLSIAALVAGTAVATGYIVSKVIKSKKKESNADLFEDNFDGCCSCACEEDLDVVIPAEETDDCAESVEEASEEKKAEEAKD